MGLYSETLFGRDPLPNRAILRAGAYSADRAEQTLRHFDNVERLHGSWMPYCFAWKDGVEFLTIFNVYGAAPTLEIMRLLNDGGTTQLGFVGSAFSKRDDIGQQLLVTKVFDQAGIVRLDGHDQVVRDEQVLEEQRDMYRSHDVAFTEVNLASVPSVMHGIESVNKFVELDKVDAVEMELSTFFHFGKQQQMKTIAYIYVSDNPHNNIIAKETAEIRHEGMKISSELTVEHLLRWQEQ